eukprot:3580103-Amphidinium_carterae.1
MQQIGGASNCENVPSSIVISCSLYGTLSACLPSAYVFVPGLHTQMRETSAHVNACSLARPDKNNLECALEVIEWYISTRSCCEPSYM